MKHAALVNLFQGLELEMDMDSTIGKIMELSMFAWREHRMVSGWEMEVEMTVLSK